MDYNVETGTASELVRIGAVPPPPDWGAGYGLEPEEPEKPFGMDDDVWDAIRSLDYLLKKASSESRYVAADSEWKIAYSATSYETALAERAHVVKTYIFDKPFGPDRHEALQMQLQVSSRHIDLTQPEYLNQEFVHPTDYSVCHPVGDWCGRQSLDYFVVPSARKQSGTNVPILDGTNLAEPTLVEKNYWVKEPEGPAYVRNGASLIPQIDAVYPQWEPGP